MRQASLVAAAAALWLATAPPEAHLVPPAAAQAGDPDGERAGAFPEAGVWWRSSEVVRALGLTPDQVNRLEAIVRSERGRLVDLRAEVVKARLDLDDALAREPFDEQAVMPAAERFEARRADLARARTAMLVRMRGVLTKAQYDVLRERMRERAGRRFRDRGSP